MEEYNRVLTMVHNTGMSLRDLLGATYANFTRVRCVAELLIVAPEIALELIASESGFMMLQRKCKKELKRPDLQVIHARMLSEGKLLSRGGKL